MPASSHEFKTMSQTKKTDGTFEEAKEKAKTLLEKNERFGEGLSWLLIRNGSLSCRKFSTITGTSPEWMEDLDLVNIHAGGSPTFYINRVTDEGTAVHEDSIEEINKELLDSLKELQASGFEVPVEMSVENLVWRLLDEEEWLSNVNGEIWYGSTDRALRVDKRRFGFPLLVRKGRSLSLTERGKKVCAELNVLEDYDPQFAQRLDQAQSIGVYTAINEERAPFFSWVYTKVKEQELSQEQIESVLLQIESNLKEREVNEQQVDEAIDQVIEDSEEKEEREQQ